MLDLKSLGDLRVATRLAQQCTLLLEITMKTLQDLTDKITELAADEADYAAREQAIVDALQKQVDDLKAQVAAGVTPDVQAQIDQIQAIIDAIPATPGDTSTTGA